LTRLSQIDSTLERYCASPVRLAASAIAVYTYAARTAWPTALYCCNYNMTVGALRMIKEQGLRIPDDISLVSFDDVPLFRLHEAGITAVAQPIAKIAETIAGILASRLSARGAMHAPHAITLDCDIILRGSTRRLITPEEVARHGRS